MTEFDAISNQLNGRGMKASYRCWRDADPSAERLLWWPYRGPLLRVPVESLSAPPGYRSDAICLCRPSRTFPVQRLECNEWIVHVVKLQGRESAARGPTSCSRALLQCGPRARLCRPLSYNIISYLNFIIGLFYR